jgi:hypothetical protein
VGLWLFNLGLNSDSRNFGRKGGVDVVVIVVAVVEEGVSWARRGVFGVRARAVFNGTPGREGAVERWLRLLAMMAFLLLCGRSGSIRLHQRCPPPSNHLYSNVSLSKCRCMVLYVYDERPASAYLD